MTSSVGGKGQKMPAPSVGGLLPEEEPVGLRSEGGPDPPSDAAGLPEEEADLLGGGTGLGGAGPASGGALGLGAVADAGAEAR